MIFHIIYSINAILEKNGGRRSVKMAQSRMQIFIGFVLRMDVTCHMNTKPDKTKIPFRLRVDLVGRQSSFS